MQCRRTTDGFIRRELRKTPLDVGASGIAQTAHVTLGPLVDIRARVGLAIPLAWAPGDVTDVAAIEVYAAATLVAQRLPSKDY